MERRETSAAARKGARETKGVRREGPREGGREGGGAGHSEGVRRVLAG